MILLLVAFVVSFWPKKNPFHQDQRETKSYLFQFNSVYYLPVLLFCLNSYLCPTCHFSITVSLSILLTNSSLISYHQVSFIISSSSLPKQFNVFRHSVQSDPTDCFGNDLSIFEDGLLRSRPSSRRRVHT